MEGALSSTVYRGLPFIGGQPLPRHMMPWPRRGVRGPRFPSARARAVGPSESPVEASAGGASPVFERTGNPLNLHKPGGGHGRVKVDGRPPFDAAIVKKGKPIGGSIRAVPTRQALLTTGADWRQPQQAAGKASSVSG